MKNNILYYYTTLEAFFEKISPHSATAGFSLPACSFLYTQPAGEYEYGLGLLREAIDRYEKAHPMSVDHSKTQIPFFRNDRLKLIGPEEEMYVASFYEDYKVESRWKQSGSNHSLICLGLEYDSLMEYCIFENASLFRCEYDREAFIRTMVQELENGEYEKFDYDEEHTMFCPGSRFASLIYQACSKVRKEEFSEENEWRITLFKEAQDVCFSYRQSSIIPYCPVQLPWDALKTLTLPAGKDSGKIVSGLKLVFERKGICDSLEYGIF